MVVVVVWKGGRASRHFAYILEDWGLGSVSCVAEHLGHPRGDCEGSVSKVILDIYIFVAGSPEDVFSQHVLVGFDREHQNGRPMSFTGSHSDHVLHVDTTLFTRDGGRFIYTQSPYLLGGASIPDGQRVVLLVPLRRDEGSIHSE